MHQDKKMFIDTLAIGDPEVAEAIIFALFAKVILPLFNSLQPGCKKKGKFSSAKVILPSISRAVAPLFARIAIVFSGLNIAYHRIYTTDVIDLPD